MTIKTDGIRDLPDILFPTVELVDLPEWGCKWPYEGLKCCGRQRLPDRPYCQDHYQHIRRAGSHQPDLTAQAQMKLQPGRRPKPRPQVTLMLEDIG